MQEVITVILADDHPLIRGGVRAVLHTTADIQVVAETGTTEGLVALCQNYHADIVVLDVNMPGPGLVNTVSALRQECPETQVVILSAVLDEATVRAATTLGVVGYVLKSEATDCLATVLRTVKKGATWYSSAVMQYFVRPATTYLELLTPRELEILSGIAAGRSNAELAQQFHLSHQTIRNYTTRLYDKLGVTSRTAAVLWAREHRLLPSQRDRR